MAKILPLKTYRRPTEGAGVVDIGVGGARSHKLVVKGGAAIRELRREGVRPLAVSSERDARYKLRAQVLLYQAASLLAEVEGSEQRLAWLLEDCADLLVREEQAGPVV